MAARLRTDEDRRVVKAAACPSLIIASASTRSLAEATAQVGIQPICADFFCDADLMEFLQRSGGRYLGTIESFADLPSLCELVDQSVPVLCGGGIENWPEVLERLTRQRQVLNASAASIRRVRHVPAIFSQLSTMNVRTAESASADNGDLSAGEWIWKPTRGSGGIGILQHMPCAETRASAAYYCQRLVEGVPLSATWVADNENASLLGVAAQCVGWRSLNADEFQYCGTSGCLILREELAVELMHVGRSIVAASGLRGVFGADFILSDGRMTLIEVNPRLTATHSVCAAHGRSPLKEHVAVLTGVNGASFPGREPNQEGKAVWPVAEFVLYAAHDVRIDRGWIPAERWWINAQRQVQRPDGVWFADIPAAGQPVRAGEPLCSLIFGVDPLRVVGDAPSAADWPTSLLSHLDPESLRAQLEWHRERRRSELPRGVVLP